MKYMFMNLAVHFLFASLDSMIEQLIFSFHLFLSLVNLIISIDISFRKVTLLCFNPLVLMSKIHSGLIQRRIFSCQFQYPLLIVSVVILIDLERVYSHLSLSNRITNEYSL